MAPAWTRRHWRVSGRPWSTNSYGVVNVNDRIQILAGREYGLSFTSEKGVGTSARIVLPKTLKGA